MKVRLIDYKGKGTIVDVDELQVLGDKERFTLSADRDGLKIIKVAKGMDGNAIIEPRASNSFVIR